MSDAALAALAAGELLLDLTTRLGRQFDITLRLDLESSIAVYEVFASVTRLGTWHVSFHALAPQLKDSYVAITIASELRRSFGEWCAVKNKKESP